MICCVSPADTNFEESTSALKYAHRARNIKNKVVVNRDPTSAAFALFHRQIRLLQMEVVRLRGGDPQDPASCAAVLKELEGGAGGGGSVAGGTGGRGGMVPPSPLMDRSYSEGTKGAVPSSILLPPTARESELESRAEDLDAEVIRLTKELKKLKVVREESTDALAMAQAERDYYKAKLEGVDVSGQLGTPAPVPTHKGGGPVATLPTSLEGDEGKGSTTNGVVPPPPPFSRTVSCPEMVLLLLLLLLPLSPSPVPGMCPPGRG
jgi:hypothetical protein